MLGTKVMVSLPQPHPYTPKWTARLSIKALTQGEVALVASVFASLTAAQLGALQSGCPAQVKEVLQLVQPWGAHVTWCFQ